MFWYICEMKLSGKWHAFNAFSVESWTNDQDRFREELDWIGNAPDFRVRAVEPEEYYPAVDELLKSLK